MVTSYTSEDASRLTGAKAPQIEHLVRTGAVIPSQEALRRGVSRRYSLNNLAEIAIGVELVEMGVPVRGVGLVMERVRGAWHILADPRQRAAASVLLLSRGSSNAAKFGSWEACEFAAPEGVAAWLRHGNSGVCVNVLTILTGLEQATRDTFENPVAVFRAQLKEFQETARVRRAKPRRPESEEDSGNE